MSPRTRRADTRIRAVAARCRRPGGAGAVAADPTHCRQSSPWAASSRRRAKPGRPFASFSGFFKATPATCRAGNDGLGSFGHGRRRADASRGRTAAERGTGERSRALLQRRIAVHGEPDRPGDHRSPTGLGVNPQNAKAHNLLGACLASLGQRDQARDAFQASITANPRDPATYSNLATLELEAGNRDRAAKYLRRSAHDRPTLRVGARGSRGNLTKLKVSRARRLRVL